MLNKSKKRRLGGSLFDVLDDLEVNDLIVHGTSLFEGNVTLLKDLYIDGTVELKDLLVDGTLTVTGTSNLQGRINAGKELYFTMANTTPHIVFNTTSDNTAIIRATHNLREEFGSLTEYGTNKTVDVTNIFVGLTGGGDITFRKFLVSFLGPPVGPSAMIFTVSAATANISSNVTGSFTSTVNTNISAGAILNLTGGGLIDIVASGAVNIHGTAAGVTITAGTLVNLFAGTAMTLTSTGLMFLEGLADVSITSVGFVNINAGAEVELKAIGEMKILLDAVGNPLTPFEIKSGLFAIHIISSFAGIHLNAASVIDLTAGGEVAIGGENLDAFFFSTASIEAETSIRLNTNICTIGRSSSKVTAISSSRIDFRHDSVPYCWIARSNQLTPGLDTADDDMLLSAAGGFNLNTNNNGTGISGSQCLVVYNNGTTIFQVRIQGFMVPPVRTSNPSTPTGGATYYNSTTGHLHVYDGTNFREVSYGDDEVDVIDFTELSLEPTVETGRLYLDDGTNTTNSEPGLRQYLSAGWRDIAYQNTDITALALAATTVEAGAGLFTDQLWMPRGTPTAGIPEGSIYLDDGSNTYTTLAGLRQKIGLAGAYRDVMYHGDDVDTMNASNVNTDLLNVDTEIFDVRSTAPASTSGTLYYDDGTNTSSGYAGLRFRSSSATAGSLFNDIPMYAEGGWAPVITNADNDTLSMTAQQGKWVRMGNLCYLQMYMAWSGFGSVVAGEGLYVQNNPFNGDATFTRQGIPITFLSLNGAKSADKDYQLQMTGSANRLTITVNNYNAGNYLNVFITDIDGTGVLQASGWFFTDYTDFPL